MMAEDITRPYLAVRRSAAWRDRSGEGRVEVRGADRIGWLQGLLTNDIAALQPGQGCYAAYLTPQGRMLTDVCVLAFDEACWLDLPAVAHRRVLERLEMFVITEDVVLRDLTAEVARIAVHGPSSPDLVTRLVAPAEPGLAGLLGALPEHHHLDLETRWGEVVVAGRRDLGVTGFDLYAPAGSRDDLIRRLTDDGAVPLDAAAWDACRIEAGRPAYGTDMDEDTIPIEAGIELRALSFTKGCYVGQEVIIRVRDRGHGRVARHLVGLSAAGRDASAALVAGDALFAGDREVGRVTSAAFSPALGRSIALGYVHRDHAVEGRALQARAADRACDVTVTTLPFLPSGARVGQASS